MISNKRDTQSETDRKVAPKRRRESAINKHKKTFSTHFSFSSTSTLSPEFQIVFIDSRFYQFCSFQQKFIYQNVMDVSIKNLILNVCYIVSRKSSQKIYSERTSVSYLDFWPLL